MYVKEKVEFAAIFSTHHFHQIFFLPRCFQPSCNGNRFENDSPRGSRIEFSNPTLRSRVLNISTQVTIKWHCFSLHCLFFSSTYQNKISIFLVLLRRKTTGWVLFVWLTWIIHFEPSVDRDVSVAFHYGQLFCEILSVEVSCSVQTIRYISSNPF